MDPTAGLDKCFSVKHHAMTAYVRTGRTVPRIFAQHDGSSGNVSVLYSRGYRLSSRPGHRLS